MAERQVALFRGINVGKAKRIAMAELREVVAGLGFTDVTTLLNSGNVVYSAGKTPPDVAARRIEEAVMERFGVPTRVTMLRAAEVEAVIAENPLLNVADNPSRLLVAVPGSPTDVTRLAGVAKESWGTERVALGGRVAYVWCPEGILESRAAAAIGKVLKDGVTSRNWATFVKLRALVTG